MDVLAAFERAFTDTPQVTASAPGRVNLIGEHIDYNGGMVLPAALPRQVHVALAPTHTSDMSIASSRFEAVHKRPIGEARQDHWTDYAMGALNKATELGWLNAGADLAIESELPDGAGVSSSAALITAILRAAAQIAEVTPDPVDIALQARAVENDYIGVPCGIMDQFAVGLAAYGKAIALNTQTMHYEQLDIPADWRFLTVHTGIRRALSDGRYATRFEECRAAKAALDTDDICTLSTAQHRKALSLPTPLNQRVRHTVSEHQRTLAARAALIAGNIDQFAEQMRASHHSYTTDFDASLPEIDAMIAHAHALGAKAARLTGGGFGGCIVVLLEEDQAETWYHAFRSDYPTAWLI